MLASRSMKPKLSLSTSASASATPQSKRPSLSLNLPSPIGATMSLSSSALRSPISPSPISPTARNTRLNQRGYSTLQQPSFAYANSYAASKSILKKSGSGSGSAASKSGSRRLQFRDEPTVHAITPIECEDAEGYYGGYGAGGAKMSREERRWARR